MHWAVTVDFDREILAGAVEHTVAVNGAKVLRLDCKGLVVSGASVDGVEAKWAWAGRHAVLGDCLQVALPAGRAEVKVRVVYETREGAEGVQWLAAAQTVGKKQPFLYTQFQAILARTCLPCMDTPAVKAPYSIEVTVKEGLVAVCSAPPSSLQKSEAKDDSILDCRRP